MKNQLQQIQNESDDEVIERLAKKILGLMGFLTQEYALTFHVGDDRIQFDVVRGLETDAQGRPTILYGENVDGEDVSMSLIENDLTSFGKDGKNYSINYA